MKINKPLMIALALVALLVLINAPGLFFFVALIALAYFLWQKEKDSK